jgi:hypothetical protein
MAEILTRRWDKLNPHEQQSACFRSTARFNINHSGRRSGKTEIAKRKIVKLAFKGSFLYPDWYGFVAAPTRIQAKRIYWADLKALVPRQLLRRDPDESNLILHTYPNSQIHVLGMDRPERVEGSPWDYGLLDEFGNMKSKAWQEHVRPALSDRKGKCDFIGVPEGRNHYFDLTEKAKESKDHSWAVWHWPSWEILPEEEIEAAKHDMDELVFNQEYGGEFISFTGRVYYTFNNQIHIGRYKQFYDSKRPLVLCFDFNVSPGTASVIQELGTNIFKHIRTGTVTTVLDEVYVPRQSNTPIVCRKIIEKYKDHQGLVLCYGDSTGGSTGTAKVKGNDWDLIKQELYPYFGQRLFFNVPIKNPRERQRVNAVNSRFLSYSGDVRMVIDGNCKYTIKDFEGVRVIEGSAGEIDKKSDPMLTHLSDGIGYYIHKEFPISRYYSKEEIARMHMEEGNKKAVND